MKLVKAHFINKGKPINCSDTFTYSPQPHDVLALEYNIGVLMINLAPVSINLSPSGKTWRGNIFHRGWYSYKTSFAIDDRLYHSSDNDGKILDLITAAAPMDLLDGLLVNNEVAVWLRNHGFIKEI